MAHRSNQTTGRQAGVASDERTPGGPRELGSEPDTSMDEGDAQSGRRTEERRAEGIPADAPGGSAAREMGERAKERAHDLRTEAEDKARELGSMARRKVEEAGHAAGRTVSGGASRAGEHLRSVAGALIAASDRLEEEGEGRLAEYARETASQVSRMSGYLQERDASTMVSDLEERARANPGAFVGGTMVTGFVLGRFLRSSGRRARAEEGRATADLPARPGVDTPLPPATPVPDAYEGAVPPGGAGAP